MVGSLNDARKPGTARQKRGARRRAVARPSTLRIGGEAPIDVLVEDLTPAGFAFTAPLEVACGEEVAIGLAGGGLAQGNVVWRDGRRHGCVFDPPLTRAQESEAFTLHAEDVVRTLHPDAPEAADAVPGRAPGYRLAALVLAGAGIWALVFALVRGLNGGF